MDNALIVQQNADLAPLEAIPMTKPVAAYRHRIAVRGIDLGRAWLSRAERMVIETYMLTGNYSECARVVKKELGRPMKSVTAKRWIEKRSSIRAYIGKRMEEMGLANITEDEYVAKMRGYAEGDIEVNGTTLGFWKLIGLAKGFLKPEVQVNQQMNVPINILQANGEA